MISTHSNCSLFLCPEQSVFTITDTQSFVSGLQKIGLIAQNINPQTSNQHYFTGENYLDYIAYMGCAPTIQFEAEDKNDNFCFIKLHHKQKAELICSQMQSRAPHCPNCKKPVKHWQVSKTATTIKCQLCDTTSNIEDFNWRKMAGYARLFIEITDIFPKEAIPQPLLLEKLADITKLEWRYFYSCR